MKLPVMPPVVPMLSKGAADVPEGEGWLYEPKWDGFRGIVFRDGDEVVIGSRKTTPLQRYFPEVVEALKEALEDRCVVDGEIVVAGEQGLDFDSLQLRLHPAESRIRRLAAEIPASFVAFDILARDKRDLRKERLDQRREELEQALRRSARVGLTPQTTDPETARDWFTRYEGALRGCRDRPTVLKRFPNGAEDEFFFQKRVPEKRPGWLQTVVVHFPSGRSAELLAPQDTAHLIWAINLGCIDLNPWPVRRPDVDHPDELRVDLDPTPEAGFAEVRRVAMVVREVLEEHGLTGYPKTSGSRGIHVYVRIEPRWGFTDVRRAALALARAVERNAPQLATTAWWKEQRHGVFLDYNQNARDRTIASAYSVRPTPDARVSAPLRWDEVSDVEPADLTLKTVPARVRQGGDPESKMDARAGNLDSLLELAQRDQREGLGDAPWPPHFAKQEGEPLRVQPSRAKKRPPEEG
jgi:DNA ligase D-like protein (predicted polymerase)